jgi:pSer/pThr/pTyr-binding forkhead associated (FHA) protein
MNNKIPTPQAYLVIHLPGQPTEEVKVYGHIISVGRAPDNHIRIDDHSVSRYHAVIELVPGGFHLSDLGSRKGTRVNEELVTTKHKLLDGDIISIGDQCKIEFYYDPRFHGFSGGTLSDLPEYHLLTNTLKPRTLSKIKVTGLATIPVLLAASIWGLFHYNYVITTSNSPTPIDMWIGIGFERRQIEDALSGGVLSAQDYQSKKGVLIAQEDQIAKVYPRNMAEFAAYNEGDEKKGNRPVEFWISLFASIVASIGTMSAILLAWRQDRRTAKELGLKLRQLQQQLENAEVPKIVIP